MHEAFQPVRAQPDLYSVHLYVDAIRRSRAIRACSAGKPIIGFETFEQPDGVDIIVGFVS